MIKILASEKAGNRRLRKSEWIERRGELSRESFTEREKP